MHRVCIAQAGIPGTLLDTAAGFQGLRMAASWLRIGLSVGVRAQHVLEGRESCPVKSHCSQ